MTNHLKKIFFIVILFSFHNVFSQTFNMSNLTVNDCNGTFLDSDNTSTGNYNHNENLVFSICPNGADSIIMNFSSFCTEQNLDVITFYDGPNTSSPNYRNAFFRQCFFASYSSSYKWLFNYSVCV
jgi:hypothetical protein